MKQYNLTTQSNQSLTISHPGLSISLDPHNEETGDNFEPQEIKKKKKILLKLSYPLCMILKDFISNH